MELTSQAIDQEAGNYRIPVKHSSCYHPLPVSPLAVKLKMEEALPQESNNRGVKRDKLGIVRRIWQKIASEISADSGIQKGVAEDQLVKPGKPWPTLLPEGPSAELTTPYCSVEPQSLQHGDSEIKSKAEGGIHWRPIWMLRDWRWDYIPVNPL